MYFAPTNAPPTPLRPSTLSCTMAGIAPPPAIGIALAPARSDHMCLLFSTDMTRAFGKRSLLENTSGPSTNTRAHERQRHDGQKDAVIILHAFFRTLIAVCCLFSMSS